MLLEGGARAPHRDPPQGDAVASRPGRAARGSQLSLFAQPTPLGFDLAGELERLVADVSRVCRGFSHIDPRRLLIGWTTSRRRRRFGVYATIYPLRFARGATSLASRGGPWHLPRVLRDGNEIYYVITFYIPRFFSLDATGRLTTVFHELYHVNEACDGDLRRFPGYESHHGASSRAFESGFQRDLAVYVASRRSRLFHDLLHLSYQEIVERYGSIRPRRIRRPVLSRDRATWEFGGIQLQGGSQPPIARN